MELAQAQRLVETPDEVRQIHRTLLGEVAETPKPGSALLHGVTPRIILGNGDALAGVAQEAASLGIDARVAPTPIRGGGAFHGRGPSPARRDRGAQPPWAAREDAHTSNHALPLRPGVGRRDDRRSVATPGSAGGRRNSHSPPRRRCTRRGRRGAASRSSPPGPTDATDRPTRLARSSMATRGHASRSPACHPQRDLDAHDAYPALDAAGALLRTGMTGTNVNDVVIALLE